MAWQGIATAGEARRGEAKRSSHQASCLSRKRSSRYCLASSVRLPAFSLMSTAMMMVVLMLLWSAMQASENLGGAVSPRVGPEPRRVTKVVRCFDEAHQSPTRQGGGIQDGWLPGQE